MQNELMPFVVSFDVGCLEPAGVAIRITYATSKKRFKAKQWDKVVYEMRPALAKQLAELLRQETSRRRPQGPKHH